MRINGAPELGKIEVGRGRQAGTRSGSMLGVMAFWLGLWETVAAPGWALLALVNRIEHWAIWKKSPATCQVETAQSRGGGQVGSKLGRAA